MTSDYEPTPEQKRYQPLFNLVSPKDNWKLAIRARVSPKALRELGATKSDLGRAVTFYTGSVATIGRDPEEPTMLLVTAAGYYAAIGA